MFSTRSLAICLIVSLSLLQLSNGEHLKQNALAQGKRNVALKALLKRQPSLKRNLKVRTTECLGSSASDSLQCHDSHGNFWTVEQFG